MVIEELETQQWLDNQPPEVRIAYETARDEGYDTAVHHFVEFIERYVHTIDFRGVCPVCSFGIGYNWPACDICMVARTKLT